MGDIVIAQSEYLFFDRHHLDYEIYSGKIRTGCLVYGGGGIFVREWQNAYQWIIELFRRRTIKRIVILPSSFRDCPDLIDVLDERFTVFCREKASYDYIASSGTDAEVILENDMAFYLTPDFSEGENVIDRRRRTVHKRVSSLALRVEDRRGYKIASFLRTDTESNVDWERYRLQSTLDLSLCVCSDARDPEECNFYSKLFFAGINAADIVITDRLHVGICSMLSGKDVFLLDNSYGKVSGVYEQSMKNLSRIRFINNADDLRNQVDRAIENGEVKRTASLKNLEKIGEALA